MTDSFDASYRPVPLTTHVLGQGYVAADNSSKQFQFWRSLNRNVPELVRRFSNNRPCIIFCHSKKETEDLADLLATANEICIRGNENHDIAAQTKIERLQRALFSGIAYHHAGLDVEDRRLIEQAFSAGKLRALCATSTLAMGVNLPAHLVIVKGTKAWRGGENGYQDIDHASLLQMIGRAGRPGYDKAGTAILMTDNGSKSTLQSLVASGLPPARSQLLQKLDEVINAEISQRVITNADSAANWIKGTLYGIQVMKDPSLHGINVRAFGSIDAYLIQIVVKSIQRLKDLGAVDQEEGGLVPEAASHIMSQQLVPLQAMQLLVQIPFNCSQGQLLKTLSEIEGLQRPVRRTEKKFLNKAQ